MSNLYQLTQNLHKIIQKKAKKYGLEIEIEKNCEENWYEIFDNNGKIIQRIGNVYLYEPINREPYFKRLCPAIQAPQIRQILVGLQEVLGENYQYKQEKWLLDNLNKRYENKELTEYSLIACLETSVEKTPKYQAEALCQKWLDGLNPLIDREPILVLTELVKISQSI